MKNQRFTYLGDGMNGTCLISAEETSQILSLFHINTTRGAGVPIGQYTVHATLTPQTATPPVCGFPAAEWSV